MKKNINGVACYEHHTATIRQYVSRRLTAPLYEVYDGKFGKGFRELIPNWDSSRYSYVRYWIFA